MATPSDLIAHYSKQAFLTRLAALTFVGGVVGGAWDKLGEPTIGTVVGFALIIVVGSLAELNRRYTHSYLSACRAAAAYHDLDKPEDRANSRRWSHFLEINETPWERLGGRFALLWLTYLPGLLLGIFLVGRSYRINGSWKGLWLWLAILLALGILLWTMPLKAFRCGKIAWRRILKLFARLLSRRRLADSDRRQNKDQSVVTPAATSSRQINPQPPK